MLVTSASRSGVGLNGAVARRMKRNSRVLYIYYSYCTRMDDVWDRPWREKIMPLQSLSRTAVFQAAAAETDSSIVRIFIERFPAAAGGSPPFTKRGIRPLGVFTAAVLRSWTAAPLESPYRAPADRLWPCLRCVRGTLIWTTTPPTTVGWNLKNHMLTKCTLPPRKGESSYKPCWTAG